MKKILITGKTGTVGQNLNFGIGFSSHEYDLRDKDQCNLLFMSHRPDAVVHCAAKVGGLKFHIEQKYKLFYDNILINTNVLEACKNMHVPRVLSFLSSCIFSEEINRPYKEEDLHIGFPAQVHYPYGFAKRMLEIQSRICYEEHGLIYNCIIPTNIYGPKDDFNLETGHVIGVLIYKAHQAKLNDTSFSVWGDGEQEREFLYVDDVAKLTEWALEYYNDKEPLIFCNNQTIKIKYIATLIARAFGIENKLEFDTTKPSGQKIRRLSGNKLLSLNDFPFTSIENGIEKTIEWYLNNYPNIRK